MPQLEIGVKSQSEPAAACYSEYSLRIADVQFDAIRQSQIDPEATFEAVHLSGCFYCKRSLKRQTICSIEY
jgi:hypothetical protein